MNDKWMNKLKMSAHTNGAKDLHSQLQSVIDFYNRPSVNHGLKKIDWDHWTKEI